LRFQRNLMINLAFHTVIRYLRIANIRMARRIGNPWFREPSCVSSSQLRFDRLKEGGSDGMIVPREVVYES
jgi:hypothetical protein